MRPTTWLSTPTVALVAVLLAPAIQLVASIELGVILNALAMIGLMLAWLQGASFRFILPRLPIMMADDEASFKDQFKYIILAIVVLVVGTIIVSIVGGVGLYILGIFNSTVVKIPSIYNFLGPISPALGSIFEILVVVLIIVALVLVIKRLMRVADEF
jgi:hypothetical protein